MDNDDEEARRMSQSEITLKEATLLANLLETYSEGTRGLHPVQEQRVLRKFFFMKFDDTPYGSTPLEDWCIEGLRRDWHMPQVAWWKRLFFIRHFRTIYHTARVQSHYTKWGALGRVSIGYDEWVLWGMWRAMELKPPK